MIYHDNEAAVLPRSANDAGYPQSAPGMLQVSRRHILSSRRMWSDTSRAHQIIRGGEGQQHAGEHSTSEEEAVTKLEAAFRQLADRAAAGRLKALPHLTALVRDAEAQQNVRDSTLQDSLPIRT